MPAAKFAEELPPPSHYAVTTMNGQEPDIANANLWEPTVSTETREQMSELHWTRHAERYLALVRAALAKDPDDEQLLELLQAMEAALARKLKRPLH
jgi:hypothetical protein